MSAQYEVITYHTYWYDRCVYIDTQFPALVMTGAAVHRDVGGHPLHPRRVRCGILFYGSAFILVSAE